ncbi:MAG: hypothetical protein UHO61_01715 [Acutalibacteraceae bacterium]|nr:hypothetical protein [Acutalibacteraceae bacterium]
MLPPFFVLRSHEFAGIRGISKMSAKQAEKVGDPNRNGFDSRQPIKSFDLPFYS